MSKTSKLGAVLALTGVLAIGGAGVAAATERTPKTWPHGTPSCSLEPQTAGGATVVLVNVNDRPRHLQLWSPTGQLRFNAELAPGEPATALEGDLVLWAGGPYHLSDYGAVGWCGQGTTTTTEATTSTTEPTTTTSEVEQTTSTTGATTSTTEPTTTTTAPTSTTAEPTTSTTVAEPTTSTTVGQGVVLGGGVVRQSTAVGDPSRPGTLPHTGRGTGQLALAGVALIAAGGVVLEGRRRGMLPR